MNCLIVISHLYMGGFSKSLLHFLLCAQDIPGLSLSLLMLDDVETELDRDIPPNVTVRRLSKPSYQRRLSAALRLGCRHGIYSLKERWYQLWKHRHAPEAAFRDYVQEKQRYRARCLAADFSFAADFDAVISWEEGFCNDVLVDCIPTRYKIGFVHPNYQTALFSQRVDSYYFRRLDRIVTISEACCQALKEVFPREKDKIVCVPNRLNTAFLNTQAAAYTPDLDPSCPCLLTVARLIDADKAVFRIVDLCQALKKAGFSFRWYLIGDGPDKAALCQRVADQEVADRLIYLGEQTNPLPYTRQADLFVLPSHREGRPVAVDEALLLGTPALVTRYSSAHEQVADGKTGWIVDDSFEALYAKLSELLSHPALLHSAATATALCDRHAFEDCSALLSLIPATPPRKDVLS